ncbi:MAG: ClbS/DfsB family four-helix bundle protein [Chloroflexi bacterium]|nr:ClbS/DfsB family four-helix bundle protein [Chloroflexota bacterium]
MIKTSSKKELIKKIRTERTRLSNVWLQIPKERLTTPGVVGDWSVKDLLSLICWSEHKIVGLIHTHKLTDAKIWELSDLERATIIIDRAKDRPFIEVRAEANQLIHEVLTAINKLDVSELDDPAGFQGLPAGYTPRQFIAANTYERYKAHLPDLQAWLNKGS